MKTGNAGVVRVIMMNLFLVLCLFWGISCHHGEDNGNKEGSQINLTSMWAFWVTTTVPGENGEEEVQEESGPYFYYVEQLGDDDEIYFFDADADEWVYPAMIGTLEGNTITIVYDMDASNEVDIETLIGTVDEYGTEIDGELVEDYDVYPEETADTEAYSIKRPEYEFRAENMDPMLPEELVAEATSTSCGNKDFFRDRIVAAGKNSYDVNGDADHETIGDPSETSAPTEDGKNTLVCRSQQQKDSEVRNLSDSMLLNPETNVYPGAIIQSKGLYSQTPAFNTVAVARAGGKITIHNLNFQPGAKYSTTVDEVSEDTINQAIQDMLNNNNIVGTTAAFDYLEKVAYSDDHLAFQLGLDARYMGFNMKSDLKYDKKVRKNHIMMSLIQKFYTVSFIPPSDPVKFFVPEDDGQYCDYKNQITPADPDTKTPANPPLYVSQVTYGRAVILLITSEYSELDIKASLEAAYKNLAGSIKVNGNLTAEQVLGKSQITYHVLGGSASAAAKALGTASPGEMYNAVKTFLKENAEISAKNPGAAISYTLNYVDNDDVAAQMFSAQYTSQDCAIKAATPSFTIAVNSVDDDVTISVGGKVVRKITYRQSTQFILDQYIDPTKVNYVEVVLHNIGGPAKMGLYFYRDGAQIIYKNYDKGFPNGDDRIVYDAVWRLDPTTGDIALYDKKVEY